MKALVKILFVLMLIAVFSSCTKTETEGFEDVITNTKSKSDFSNEITEEEGSRMNPSNRSSDGEGDGEITDDDDDDDDDEGKSEVDK